MLGADADTQALLHEFSGRVGADPQTIHVAHGSYHDTRRYLTALGVRFEELDRASSQPVPSFSKSEFFRRTLPAGAVVRLLANLVRARRAGEARELDVMPWGGAYNRLPIDATAFPHRRERFLLKHTVSLRPHASQEQTQATRRWLAECHPSIRIGRGLRELPRPGALRPSLRLLREVLAPRKEKQDVDR